MSLIKRTYALPAETLERFEKAVAAGKRSATISSLIESWLEGRRKARLRKEVVEGCREMASVYLETEKEYNPLEEEVERGASPVSKTRRDRSRKA
jgi:metal-responsive CopG/Arc/MetJ family transcriptional regulator